MPRVTLSGPVHMIEVNGELITVVDSAMAGDQSIVKALQKRLAHIDEPTIADVEAAAAALCARRDEPFAGCACDVCSPEAKGAN